MTDEQLELALLRGLKKRVDRMFEYSGWVEGCDDDSADACLDVERYLRAISEVLSDPK